jgi:sulfoxide reductase heme-binding subunit YedZ
VPLAGNDHGAGMSHAYWYATRATGVVALILLTLVVALGVAGTLRMRSDRWPRFLVAGLHRNLTLLTLVFLAGHIVTTVLDSFTPIRLQDAFVPFLASYRALWLGFGAVALDLLLALTATSFLRARIGFRTWRSLHWLAYAAWPVALAHGLGTGSDARFGWLQALSVACIAVVAAAVALRIRVAAASPARRALAAGGAAAVLLAGTVWYVGGPGAPGWARKAGTPSALLGHTPVRQLVAARRTAQTVSEVPARPFSGTLDGHISSTLDQATGLVRLDIRARTTGGVRGRLWVRLQGVPLDDGGVQLNASGVAFGTTSAPNEYVGKVVALQGTRLEVALRNAAGRRLTLQVALTVDQATRSVTGTVRGSSQ